MSPEAGPSGTPEAPATPRVCSAKRCSEPAVWALRWNNPKLHTPERRKVWLACEEHRGRLGDFLDRRGFLRDVTTAEAGSGDADDPDDDPEGGAGRST